MSSSQWFAADVIEDRAGQDVRTFRGTPMLIPVNLRFRGWFGRDVRMDTATITSALVLVVRRSPAETAAHRPVMSSEAEDVCSK
jgi:hypothetical protein